MVLCIIVDNGVNSESEDSNDEEEIHEADDLTEKEDMETVPGCSDRAQEKWQ
ncbi:hypothetical protein DPMN_049078 [Dreissena polymorpha]|uniref:Uncharacterized protein n=1 Tax=Dreissena polymorpha TaxID=45954 RepID=A0A9D4DBW8_DREPO|nr:hypothetical protein DPMN_049078 [Dreissena polymorpha]